MKSIPDLPRKIPDISTGETVTGREVIDCRIVVADPPAGADDGDPPQARLGADGVWEVRVPVTSAPLTDLADLVDRADDHRYADDGWRLAGAVLLRRLGELVARHPVRAKKHIVQIRVPAETTVYNLRNLAQGVVLGRRRLVISRKDPAPEVRTVHIAVTDVTDPQVVSSAAESVHRGRVLGAATALAGDFDAVPATSATSMWWRRKSKAVLNDIPGTRVKTHGRGWLQRKGFGGLLATVTADTGVANPDGEDDVGFVELFWDPAAADGDLTDDRPDVLLVGGAPVPAVIRALAELKGAKKVVGLVPVHGFSLPTSVQGRADTVIDHVDGTTTRIPQLTRAARRTEISRRLAVADAVAYGVQRHRPRRVVIVGPVSSATVAALGERTGGVTGDDQLVRRVTRKGARVGERWWPMPTPEYLDSTIRPGDADLTAGAEGPDALTASLFLRSFAGDTPCVVLDTTGPSWSDSADDNASRGSTGFAARTLVEWFRK